MIADATYSEQEYPTNKGRGHGTRRSGVDMAKAADAGALCLPHHDPLRSDGEPDEIRRQLGGTQAFQIDIAYEGHEMTL